jgi:hypothetical protein
MNGTISEETFSRMPVDQRLWIIFETLQQREKDCASSRFACHEDIAAKYVTKESLRYKVLYWSGFGSGIALIGTGVVLKIVGWI